MGVLAVCMNVCAPVGTVVLSTSELKKLVLLFIYIFWSYE